MYKLKIKITLILMILLPILLIFPLVVNAADTDTTYTATSTINGVTVNWSYKLNESNEIVELVCTNISNLAGDIAIPSSIDGKNVVTLGNEAFKSATKITGVEIPSTVKEIGLWTFSGCTNLEKVDLGSVEKICDQSFNNCTALTSIKIPKTLNKGASGAPFSGCTNLKNIELEEGMTVVPDCVCASTPITEITIPSTVKEIGLWAFSGCTNLAKVNLGSVEEIAHLSFNNCTALTSIKIPKTLNKDASGAPFAGCTNLTNIELEEGMTVVPSYLCASTPITEITIPNSVEEISYYAFKDCEQLKKIIILDNVIKMGWFSTEPTKDTVFTNHNEDLTIYCYEGSTAAQYAINNNIKYVYLTKTSTGDGTNTDKDNQNQMPEGKPGDSTQKPSIDKEDTTTAPGKLPNAGIGIGLVVLMVVLLTGGIFNYFKYRNLRGI